MASYLVTAPQLVPDDTLEGNGVQLTTGMDYDGVLTQPRPIPTTTTTTGAAAGGGGSSTTATTEPTTSTTRIGVVPSDGQDGLCR